jgi:hypothetical protein
MDPPGCTKTSQPARPPQVLVRSGGPDYWTTGLDAKITTKIIGEVAVMDYSLGEERGVHLLRTQSREIHETAKHQQSVQGNFDW